MTEIPLLRDLEQRWREEAKQLNSEFGGESDLSHAADDLAVVRRTLEASLEGLERHDISGLTIHYPGGEVAGEQRDEVKPDGHWLLVADLEAALAGAQEPR